MTTNKTERLFLLPRLVYVQVNKRAAVLRGKSRIVSPFVETAGNFYLFIYLFIFICYYFLLSNIITLQKQSLVTTIP